MKKIFAFLSAAALILGAVSCSSDSKEAAYEGEEGTGTVKIAFNFDPGNLGDLTKAYTTSTAKPTTSWSDIHSLAFFLVDNTNIIKVAKELAVPTGTGAKEFQFTNIPAGNYTGYLIANYADPLTVNSNFSGTVTGVNINTFLMKLVQHTSWPQSAQEASSVAYKEAEDIFIASRANTDVTANTTNDYRSTPFTLTRAISMMRIRINQNFGNTTTAGSYNNNDIDFTAPGAGIRIRKMGVALNYLGTVSNNNEAGPWVASANNLIYSSGFNVETSAPTLPTNYGPVGSQIIDYTNGQRVWKDIRILPGGGSGTSGNKFNIVITGLAPANYIPMGATAQLGTPKLVSWVGTVEGGIDRNKILEVNIDLKNQGEGDIIPPVTETGELWIGVGLANWDAIETAEGLNL